MRVGRKTAAHADREADLGARSPVPPHRRHPDIVDLGILAPNRAAADRNLELARQVVIVGVAGKQLARLLYQGRGIADLVGVDARHGTASDVAGHIAARSHGIEADPPQGLEHARQRLDRHPVQLQVLPHRNVCRAPGIALGDIGERPQLTAIKLSVRNPDPHHEARQRLAFAPFSSDHSGAIPLGVDPPPAQIGSQPLGRNRGESLLRKPANLPQAFPRILFSLEPLCPLRLVLWNCVCHKVKNPPLRSFSGGGSDCAER